MRRTVSVTLAALAAAAMSTCPLLAGTGAQASLSAGSCASTSSVGGNNVINYCGPATASLVIGGKTYKFKNGSCQSIKVSGITVDVDLGTVVQGKDGGPVKGNGKKPWFSMDLSASSLDLLNAVYYGGKELTVGGPITVTGSVVKSGSSKGTFQTPSGASDMSGKQFSLSGSWNCHGKFSRD
jgi:hypothetical protein